ncbi:emerin-like isoform X2 [Cynocephalus volans]|uniref:emerin-like isoform X2 n=1 Tax=Cynocephalus volans TaxID=110931 RepID=UPI002FC6A8C4
MDDCAVVSDPELAALPRQFILHGNVLDLGSALEGSSDMYNLPKKDDTLLNQSKGCNDEYYEESYLTARTSGEADSVGTSKGFHQPVTLLSVADTFYHQLDVEEIAYLVFNSSTALHMALKDLDGNDESLLIDEQSELNKDMAVLQQNFMMGTHQQEMAIIEISLQSLLFGRL